MFNSITFSTQDKFSQNPIDFGHLVECMLFYQKTTILADSNILASILKHFGTYNTVELIENGYLEIIYTEELAAVMTQNNLHDFYFISTETKNLTEVIGKVILEKNGPTGKIKKEARKIADKIKTEDRPKIILQTTKNKALDQNYALKSAKEIIINLVPEFDVAKVKFETQIRNNMIEVHDNINYVALNKLYHKYISPKHSSITPAFIFSHLLDSECDLNFASRRNSELATNKMSSNLIQQNITQIINSTHKSSEISLSFQEAVLNGKTIRESYNNNLITFDELLILLKKSIKFKEWLEKDTNPDSKIVQEYINEIDKNSFLEKLPCKLLRFAIFSGIGVTITSSTAGIGLSAIDSFVMDKLFQGWKPNQFIRDINKIIKK